MLYGRLLGNETEAMQVIQVDKETVRERREEERGESEKVEKKKIAKDV